MPLHPDAMWPGRRGGKWRFGGAGYVSHTHIPSWVLKHWYKTISGTTSYVGIANEVMAATILAACVIAEIQLGTRTRVDLRIDNNAALREAISGNSRSGLMGEVIHDISDGGSLFGRRFLDGAPPFHREFRRPSLPRWSMSGRV